MRSHWTLLAVALALNVVLLVGLAFTTAPTASAACPATYVVRPGDWLSRIALRYNTTLYALLQLNPNLWYNPNFIYPGQVLCVPAQAPARNNQVAIEFDYTYAPTLGDQDWNLARGAVIRRRAVYPLENSPQAIATVSETTRISTTVGGSLQPLLLGVRTAQDKAEYVLVAVDTPDPITSLTISPTLAAQAAVFKNKCSPAPLTDLVEPGTTAGGALSLESGSGTGYVFKILGVSFVKSADLASCYGPDAGKPVAFGIYPGSDKAHYRLQIVLTRQGYGPPGYPPPASQCSSFFGTPFLAWLSGVAC